MDKTFKIYYEDSENGVFFAEPLRVWCDCEGHWLAVLDRTAFYPGGGGQPRDLGVLGMAAVINCYEEDGIIYHVLAEEPECDEAGMLWGAVDMARRWRFMQNHGGEHILSAGAFKLFDASNVGFAMSGAGFTMDLDVCIDNDDILILEAWANDALRIDAPILTSFVRGSDERVALARKKLEFGFDDMVRLVEIEGVDLCACSGLHVGRTYKIGLIKVLGAKKWKGGVRIEVVCGNDALDDYEKKHNIVKQACRDLSRDLDGLGDYIKELARTKKMLEKEVAKLRTRGQ